MILWYDLYVKTLKSQGFVVNPYDRCISNITVYGKLFIIASHVDENKLSRFDEHMNTRIIKAIAEKIGELNISRGGNHKLLGMDI